MSQQDRIERWLWDIFESLPDAMIVVGSSGEMVGVNQTACDLFGYARAELIGQSLEMLIPDGHRPLHQGHVAGYFRTPRIRPMGSGIDLAARRKDGTTVPVDISLSSFDSEMGRLIVAAVRDITDRKRAEQALRESQERFDLAVRGTDAGIWDWDLRTDTVFFSDRWKSMLGYAPDEIRHEFSEWSTRLHPDDRQHALATIEAYLAGQTAEYELEHRLRHKDGAYRWILARGAAVRDAQGKFYRMVGSQIDVTARKEAEAAVHHYQAELVTGATIQRFLLPHQPPRVAGLEIAGRCYPAEYTAGDYFAYLAFPDGSIRRHRPRPRSGDSRGLVPFVHPVALGKPQRPLPDPRPAERPGLRGNRRRSAADAGHGPHRPGRPDPDLLQRRPSGCTHLRRRGRGQGPPHVREHAHRRRA